jgi:biotin-dependent carboxylase-like uncharacterized protein
MDGVSSRIACFLVGNAEWDAVLEMTMSGISALFDSPAVIAVTGADIAPLLDGIPVPMNRAIEVKAGSIFDSGFARSGVRSYLAVAGGFDLPPVLGSRSTNLKAGIGGFNGRKLQSGDVIPFRWTTNTLPCMARRVYEPPPPPATGVTILRAVGSSQEELFTAKGIKTFYSATYTVASESDRMGIRFEGEAVESINGTDIVSDGIAEGAVQIPNSGLPLMLMQDRQTIGGYAKIATVVTADLHRAAQLPPASPVRFEKITLADAERLYFNQRKEFKRLKRSM